MAHRSFFQVFRQLTLLVLLVAVAGGSYLTRARSTSWQEPLWVSVYPIVAGDSDKTHQYIADLSDETFLPIERFVADQARAYGVRLEQPVRVDLGNPVSSLPPPRPESTNPLGIAFWSLKLRLWASDATENQPGATPDIRMFLVYHDPDIQPSVPHSLGLQNGMLGVAYVFAEGQYTGSNNMIITHEMLHTLGATDKYAEGSNFPSFPDGYAEPERKPLYPQKKAEIMAGRIPLSSSEAIIPGRLKQVLVGPVTATEIRWPEAASQKKRPAD
jgi:hypothetical protein